MSAVWGITIVNGTCHYLKGFPSTIYPICEDRDANLLLKTNLNLGLAPMRKPAQLYDQMLWSSNERVSLRLKVPGANKLLDIAIHAW